MVLAGGLLLVVGLAGPAFGSSAASPSAAAKPTGKVSAWQPAVFTYGSPEDLAGSSDDTVSCAGTTYCAVVGSIPVGIIDWNGWLMDETNGVWRADRQVPGLAALNTGGTAMANAVSCVAPGDCVAGGFYMTKSGSYHPFVVSEKHGVWGKAQTVAGDMGAINELSCTAPGDCLAAGYSDVVQERNGAWSKSQALPGAAKLGWPDIASVSCPSAGNCTAAGVSPDGDGEAGDDGPAFVVSESDYHWTAATKVAGTGLGSANLTSVSCWSVGNCVAVGSYTPVRHGAMVGMRVTETDGHWGRAQPLGVGADVAESVSCVAGGSCVVATDSHLVTDAGGTWRKPAAVPAGYSPYAVSCPAPGDCSVAANYTDGDEDGGAVIDEVAGKWQQWNLVPGALNFFPDNGSFVNSFACGAPGNCAANGSWLGSGGPGDGWTAIEASVPVTATTVTLSAARLVYGREQAGRVSVTVLASSGTPPGSVTVTAEGTIVCWAALKAGHGSCALPATGLAAGTYEVTGYYGIHQGFAYSHSARYRLVVSKASTVTRLALSRGSVSYGHAGTERLSVSVAPRYGGSPAGSVIVKAGKTTLCFIKLRDRKGSCVLGAGRLKPGRYRLTAEYTGTASFSPSTSVVATLTVTG